MHFYNTGNDFYNTGTVIFHGDITSTSAAKLGLPYPNAYNTSNVIFLETLSILWDINTGSGIVRITVPALASSPLMTVPVL